MRGVPHRLSILKHDNLWRFMPNPDFGGEALRQGSLREHVNEEHGDPGPAPYELLHLDEGIE
jgi:hypothetical protein